MPESTYHGILDGVSRENISIRLVEWNVAMSLHTKTHLLAALSPTVAVLPESANTSPTKAALAAIGANSIQWIGSNANKGLSVVAFNGWELRIDDSYDPGYQWVMPVHLTGPGKIRLLAVWDMNHRGRGHQSARRMGACRASIPHYEEFLSGDADLVIISGDFNNSIYWDKPTKPAKFGDFMDELEARGFASAYHSHHSCERGTEAHPTLWWMKNADTTYHIDYTFVSPPDAIEAVAMGSHADWIAHSDHSPMTVDLRLIPRSAAAASICIDQHAAVPGNGDHEPQRVRQRRRATATDKGSPMRFVLEFGSLPDMRCGVNGVGLVQEFRATSFTAEWVGGVLVEVRVWGPRVLQDGSLGKRELDHRWKKSRAAGGIDMSDLPPLVGERLRSHLTE